LGCETCADAVPDIIGQRGTETVAVLFQSFTAVVGRRSTFLALGRGDDAETYTGGLKYDANNIYLATQYTQTYNASWSP
jgi:predicted porin